HPARGPLSARHRLPDAATPLRTPAPWAPKSPFRTGLCLSAILPQMKRLVWIETPPPGRSCQERWSAVRGGGEDGSPPTAAGESLRPESPRLTVAATEQAFAATLPGSAARKRFPGLRSSAVQVVGTRWHQEAAEPYGHLSTTRSECPPCPD